MSGTLFRARGARTPSVKGVAWHVAGSPDARADGLSRIAPARILFPDAADWPRAGALAGAVARGVAGAAESIRTAVDRVELIHDALTALAALRAGATLVTSDRDFDLFMQLEPGLDVLFYEC